MAKTPLQRHKSRKFKLPTSTQGVERSSGTPGTSRYVQRSSPQPLGTPGTSKYVPRGNFTAIKPPTGTRKVMARPKAKP